MSPASLAFATVLLDNWGPVEPNGTSDHNCAMFRGGSTNSGDWNDIKCENTLSYVCAE